MGAWPHPSVSRSECLAQLCPLLPTPILKHSVSPQRGWTWSAPPAPGSLKSSSPLSCCPRGLWAQVLWGTPGRHAGGVDVLTSEIIRGPEEACPGLGSPLQLSLRGVSEPACGGWCGHRPRGLWGPLDTGHPSVCHPLPHKQR